MLRRFVSQSDAAVNCASTVVVTAVASIWIPCNTSRRAMVKSNPTVFKILSILLFYEHFSSFVQRRKESHCVFSKQISSSSHAYMQMGDSQAPSSSKSIKISFEMPPISWSIPPPPSLIPLGPTLPPPRVYHDIQEEAIPRNHPHYQFPLADFMYEQVNPPKLQLYSKNHYIDWKIQFMEYVERHGLVSFYTGTTALNQEYPKMEMHVRQRSLAIHLLNLAIDCTELRHHLEGTWEISEPHEILKMLDYKFQDKENYMALPYTSNEHSMAVDM